jgi:putative chitinase
MPQAGTSAYDYLPWLNAAMAKFGIDTATRQASFLAQLAHETGQLGSMVESLNYTPQAILATFNRTMPRFTQAQAEQYGRTAAHPANQVMIANIAYANRNGNGPVESGDGWRFRGRGPGQLTGRRNYAACGAALGLDLVARPELVAEPDVGCLSFAWFWSKGNPSGRDLSILADRGRIEDISRAINGGANGLAQRLALTQRAMQVLS